MIFSKYLEQLTSKLLQPRNPTSDCERTHYWECLDTNISGVSVVEEFLPSSSTYILISHSYVCFSRYYENFITKSLQTCNPTSDCESTHY